MLNNIRPIQSNMKLDDLDIEIKNELLEQRKELCSKWKQNSAYDICFTNTDGTRYFKANRNVSNVRQPGKMPCFIFAPN